MISKVWKYEKCLKKFLEKLYRKTLKNCAKNPLKIALKIHRNRVLNTSQFTCEFIHACWNFSQLSNFLNTRVCEHACSRTRVLENVCVQNFVCSKFVWKKLWKFVWEFSSKLVIHALMYKSKIFYELNIFYGLSSIELTF